MRVRIYVLSVFIFLIASSCMNRRNNPDISDIWIATPILRFEQELFRMNTDTLPAAINYFSIRYGDFYDIYNHYIVGLGSSSDKAFEGYLNLFVNDDLNREVFQKVNEVFPDLDELENEFNQAFRYYSWFFPEREIPKLVSFISRFNYPFFTVSDYVGIGLDMFLGSDQEFYQRLGLPGYQVQNMHPEKICSEVLGNWANSLFPVNDSTSDALSAMIHEGKIMYFLSQILPDQEESLILGYNDEQMRWLEGNEEEMWAYLVEHKLVYTTNPVDIRKLTHPAPFTSYFGQNSPGRAAVWIGYKIVKSYMRRNPDANLSDLMLKKDYQEILRLSAYNP